MIVGLDGWKYSGTRKMCQEKKGGIALLNKNTGEIDSFIPNGPVYFLFHLSASDDRSVKKKDPVRKAWGLFFLLA
jgi:hypothetical protein